MHERDVADVGVLAECLLHGGGLDRREDVGLHQVGGDAVGARDARHAVAVDAVVHDEQRLAGGHG